MKYFSNLFSKVSSSDIAGIMNRNLNFGDILKEEIKAIGLTQKEVSIKMNVSLITVKRWYKGQGLSIKNLLELAEVLNLNLSKIFKKLDNPKLSFTYTIKQEKELSKNPALLAFFDLLIKGRTVNQIAKKYKISQIKITNFLVILDKLHLVLLRENNKFKILVDGEPSWNKNGPLVNKFKNVILNDYLLKLSSSENFFLHDYTEKDLLKIKIKIEELKDFISNCHNRSKYEKNNISYGFYLSLKEYDWKFDQYLK